VSHWNTKKKLRRCVHTELKLISVISALVQYDIEVYTEEVTYTYINFCCVHQWAWHVARMGEDTSMHRVLVGKPEGKRSLVRPRRRWKDNIKMDLREVGGGRGDWMELAQDRDRWRTLVGTVRNFPVP
jgi:hypothetical protein